MFLEGVLALFTHEVSEAVLDFARFHFVPVRLCR